jgi:hypothetical protein
LDKKNLKARGNWAVRNFLKNLSCNFWENWKRKEKREMDQQGKFLDNLELQILEKLFEYWVFLICKASSSFIRFYGSPK